MDGRRTRNTGQSSGLNDVGGRNIQPVQGSGQPSDGRSGRGDAGRVSKEVTLRLLNRGDAGANALNVDIIKEKSPYPAMSKSSHIGSVVPTNVAQAINEELGKLKDIDAYVQAKLGYETKEELYGALAAEQIDSVINTQTKKQQDGQSTKRKSESTPRGSEKTNPQLGKDQQQEVGGVQRSGVDRSSKKDICINKVGSRGLPNTPTHIQS